MQANGIDASLWSRSAVLVILCLLCLELQSLAQPASPGQNILSSICSIVVPIGQVI